jgi:hypothetical protein
LRIAFPKIFAAANNRSETLACLGLEINTATSWVNNPRVKYAKNKDGYELVGRERYGYTYNANGYPTSQTRSVNLGNGRPDYTYTGNYIYNLH